MFLWLILALLGCESWSVREATATILSPKTAEYLPLLLDGEDSTNAEVARRCWQLVDGHYIMLASRHRLLPKGWVIYSWCYFRPQGYEGVCGPSAYTEYRFSTKQHVDMLLCNGYSGHSILILLEYWAAFEAKYTSVAIHTVPYAVARRRQPL